MGDFERKLELIEEIISKLAERLCNPRLSDYEFNQLLIKVKDARSDRDNLFIWHGIPNIQKWGNIEYDKNKYPKTGEFGRPYKIEIKSGGCGVMSWGSYGIVQLPIPEKQQ